MRDQNGAWLQRSGQPALNVALFAREGTGLRRVIRRPDAR